MDAPAHIIPAQPEDALGIAIVSVDAWRSAYAGILPDEVLLRLSPTRQMRYWQRHIQQRGQVTPLWQNTFVVKVPNDTVLGFGCCGPARDSGLKCDAEVYSLYVDTAHLSLGIGGALLDHMFFEMIEGHVSSVAIWALADNPYRHFYHAQGGQIRAERLSNYWGKELREFAYVWPNLPAWSDQRSAKGASYLS